MSASLIGPAKAATMMFLIAYVAFNLFFVIAQLALSHPHKRPVLGLTLCLFPALLSGIVAFLYASIKKRLS